MLACSSWKVAWHKASHIKASTVYRHQYSTYKLIKLKSHRSFVVIKRNFQWDLNKLQISFVFIFSYEHLLESLKRSTSNFFSSHWLPKQTNCSPWNAFIHCSFASKAFILFYMDFNMLPNARDTCCFPTNGKTYLIVICGGGGSCAFDRRVQYTKLNICMILLC